MLRKTAKTINALEILSGERFADCDLEELYQYCRSKRLAPEQIYATMKSLGYRWTGINWIRYLPRWLDDFIYHRSAALRDMDIFSRAAFLAKQKRKR